MPIDYEAALNLDIPPVVHAYTERDTMLYALGIGFGCDPLDEAQLRYVYEKNLRAFPTMAVTLGFLSVRSIPLPIDYTRMVHAEQELELFGELPVSGEIVGKTRVASLGDRGPKGALIRLERDITESRSGRLLARSAMTVLCRGDGGFGGPAPQSPPPRACPERPADLRHTLHTLPQQALIYRLSGDVNPLHADPELAHKGGFERPILHGLATFGLVGRAVSAVIPDARLQFLSGRFIAPVFPGESLEVEFWKEQDGWTLRASVPSRQATVFGNGHARLRPTHRT
jgi:acyl dehydratase